MIALLRSATSLEGRAETEATIAAAAIKVDLILKVSKWGVG